MKEYDVLISEETVFRYKIKAKNKEEAEAFAWDNHQEGIETNRTDTTTDRVEVIDVREVEK